MTLDFAAASRQCDAIRAAPLSFDHVIRHHPVLSVETRVYRAGELLGTIVEDPDARGWWSASTPDGFREPVRSRQAGAEWLLGRATVREMAA